MNPLLQYHRTSNLFQGTIIYVNYGRESDFRWLEQQNILVAGQIVMARYGKGGRSGKVWGARNQLTGEKKKAVVNVLPVHKALQLQP